MKNFTLLLLALLTTTFAFAQDHELVIKDLVTKGQTAKLKITEAHYQPSNKNSGQKGGAVGAYIYVVHRKIDAKSAKIGKAASTKKVYSNPQIWLKAGSKLNKYKLNHMTISNYTAHYVHGKGPTEIFTVRLSTQEKVN